MTRYFDRIAAFPPAYWVLILISGSNRFASSIVFPFYAVYITDKFDVGLTEVGILFSLIAFAQGVGSVIGAPISDYLGRKPVIIFSLTAGALGYFLMIVINQIPVLFLATAVINVLTGLAVTSSSTVIADLVDSEGRMEGFAIHRIVGIIAFVIGPILGGLFLGGFEFWLLALFGGLILLLAGLLAYYLLPETTPLSSDDREGMNLPQVFIDYWRVIIDWKFFVFLLLSVPLIWSHNLINNFFSVYLRDVFDFSNSVFVNLSSLNILIVIIFQLIVAFIVSDRKLMRVMALGGAFLTAGMFVFGRVSQLPGFSTGMILVSIAEMILFPAMLVITAKLAPKAMRARYFAVQGLFVVMATGSLSQSITGGIVDVFGWRAVWGIAAAVCLVVVAGYLILDKFNENANQAIANVENG